LGNLIPSFSFQYSPSFFLIFPAPLFKKERNSLIITQAI
jgi:hypothetical protein